MYAMARWYVPVTTPPPSSILTSVNCGISPAFKNISHLSTLNSELPYN